MLPRAARRRTRPRCVRRTPPRRGPPALRRTGPSRARGCPPARVRPARSCSRTSPPRKALLLALLDRLDRQLENLALRRVAHRVELAHLPADGDGVEEPPAGDLVHLRVV